MLSLPSGWIDAIGVLLLTHSLIYSAYLSHEFIHGNIFKGRYKNEIYGTLMLWLNGGCYYGFKALTKIHIAHHVDRADILTFDIPVAIQKLPRLIRTCVLVLEWFYFPIVSFWSRWQSITAPWWNSERHNERGYITFIITVRIALFSLLGIISFKALLLYFLSYIGMITLLRWMDAFQHTYEAFPPGTILPKRDRTYEQANTFSNLLSRRYSWLNLLFLNFGYHSAHHTVMKCPWHSLHELNREFFKDDEVRYIPLLEQLFNYHRFRVTRLLAGQGEVLDASERATFENFYGAVDVSFLMIY